jgi:AcrR family transcriptional regulator
MSISEPLRRPGRPRCPRAHNRVLRAALDLLVEHGWERLTIEAIAHRAEVGKATIYRWWPNKAALLLDAIIEEVAAQIAFADTGDLRADLTRQMKTLVDFFNGPHRATICAIAAAAQDDPGVACAFRERWLLPRRELGREMLTTARERNQIPSGWDEDLLLDLLYGPIYFRLMAGHAPLNHTLVDQIVDAVFGAVERPPQCSGMRGEYERLFAQFDITHHDRAPH